MHRLCHKGLRCICLLTVTYSHFQSVLSSKPEAKDLTADEIARRKDLENQLKLEFEVFMFGICEVF